jgi:hypothetical protein
LTEGEEKPLNISRGHAGLRCSDSLHHFFRRHNEIFEFLFFSVQLASRADEAAYIASKALAGAGGTEEDRKRFEELEKNKDPVSRRLRQFGAFQSENMCIRLVDNFLSYLSASLQAILLKRPEMLRSSETARLEDVLKFTRFKDLISFLADRKINELGYGGLQGIEEFVVERTGLKLVANVETRALLLVAVELRNIYTHNRGIVNDLFLRRLANVKHSFSFKRGTRYHADLDTIVELANALFECAAAFDGAVSKKFKLKQSKFSR